LGLFVNLLFAGKCYNSIVAFGFHLITVTDDFIVDAWVNGRRIDDTSRQLLAEIFGATVERIERPTC
jgi:hypothetical protein